MANELYRAWNDMVQGYKTGSDNMLEFGVKSWMDLNPENPFESGTAESNQFVRIRNHYTVWRMNGADAKVNRKRMIESARVLCSMYPKRPYKFDRTADTQAKAAAAASEEERLKAEAEARQKAIEEEANRIVAQEQKNKERAIQREKARLEWEEAERKAIEDEKQYQEDLKAAIEKKRADMVEVGNETVVLGVVPEAEGTTDEKVMDMKDLKSAEINPDMLPKEGLLAKMKRRFRGDRN